MIKNVFCSQLSFLVWLLNMKFDGRSLQSGALAHPDAYSVVTFESAFERTCCHMENQEQLL